MLVRRTLPGTKMNQKILLTDWDTQINYLAKLSRTNYWQFLKEWQEFTIFLKYKDRSDFERQLLEKLNYIKLKHKRPYYKRGTPAKDVQGIH